MDLNTLKTVKDSFIQEIEKASKGEDSSLLWLKHQIPQEPLIQEGEKFQVLVIGGTVCRKSVAVKQDGAIILLQHEKRDQVIFTTKETLLDFINQELIDDVNVLAINFAYPVEPVFENGKLDGKLLRGTKEHAFDGLIGEKIGQEVEKYVLEKRGKSIQVSLANDTACLLLSGLTLHPAGNLACGIVGTGTNTAFFIDDEHFVCLESGNFDKFPFSSTLHEVDASSITPGKYLFEKEVAGGYVFRHFNVEIKKRNINYPTVGSTYEVKQLALQTIPEVSELARELIAKSAMMVAAKIAAIAAYRKRDLVFVMDGSFFWEKDIYKNYVEEFVRELTPDYSVSFVQIEDTTLYGAAKLVC